MTQTTVLVVGATGTQGGAVADELLHRSGFEVHALTRDPSQDAAADLEEKGATIVEGDLSDPGALEDAIASVDAVFGVTDFWEHGYDTEVEHGENLVQAADRASLDHLVFSSVGGAERDTGIPHFDSKFEVEKEINKVGLPATIVRPVFFMQNFEGMRDQISGGSLAMGMQPRVPLQMLDIEDLGAFVGEAIADPSSYIGEAVELASDELTLDAIASRFTDVTGRSIRADHLTIDQVREAMGDEYAVMFEWFNEHGYEANLSELRAEHDVDFTTLEAYLEREGWAKTPS